MSDLEFSFRRFTKDGNPGILYSMPNEISRHGLIFADGPSNFKHQFWVKSPLRHYRSRDDNGCNTYT